MGKKCEFALPLTTAPMEAQLASALPDDGRDWQYEPKWDGFRCLAFRSGEAVELRAKSGKPLGRYFPEVVAMLRDFGGGKFVLDGELVIERAGKFEFDALQMRLHPAESRIRKLAGQTPATFMAFDILAGPSGEPLLDKPLAVRRKILERLLKDKDKRERLILSEFTLDVAEARRWIARSGRGFTDGVVAKLRNDGYHPGERCMVKVKRIRTADCVVGGFRYLQGSRQIGSLLLGLYDRQGKLNHVGFTSSIHREDRAKLTKKLQAIAGGPGFTGNAPGGPSRWSTERSGEWTAVKPVLVVEVRFDQVTGERFRHGTKLLRWRPDKSPRQCTADQIAN
jgi:ATP-dependent DNA ligase